MVRRLLAKIASQLEPWLTNLKAYVWTDGPLAGQAPALVTTDTALIGLILTPVEDVVTRQGVWMQAEGTARTAFATHDGNLRDLINRYKHFRGLG